MNNKSYSCFRTAPAIPVLDDIEVIPAVGLSK